MNKVCNIFSDLISTLGYSRVHGQILAALFVNKEISLKELSKKTKYSLSSISISLDMLELLGLVRRFRKDKTKEVYVKLEGDLLLALKEIVLMKIHRGIEEAIRQLDGENGEEARKIREEILRLKKYVNELNKVNIPLKK